MLLKNFVYFLNTNFSIISNSTFSLISSFLSLKRKLIIAPHIWLKGKKLENEKKFNILKFIFLFFSLHVENFFQSIL
jgi:hypothetical protein